MGSTIETGCNNVYQTETSVLLRLTCIFVSGI